MNALQPAEPAKAPRFKIFRVTDAADYDEKTMAMSGLNPTIASGIQRFVDGGADEGVTIKMLFSIPGFSLTYAWFKRGYPLPLHSHNVDCLYYILEGSLEIGTEKIGRGEGFFVGSGVPYTYRPGPEGVEVLEFRTASEFDIQFLGKTETYWQNIIDTLEKERPGWLGQERPSAGSYRK
jgi:mannose-6-phosphate isomerase-like protein (cupin superfamily)